MSKLRSSFSIAFFVSLACYGICAQDWRRIELLKSTRTDVEAMFGPSSGHYYSEYDLKDGQLYIEYSSGLEGTYFPTRVDT
jgi:hypothetical protein